MNDAYPFRDIFDAERLFQSQDDRGCFGEQLFWDHCHPDPEGHRRLARAIGDAMDDMGLAAQAR